MTVVYRTAWCAVLAVALATGVAAQSETQAPKRTPAEEKAFQDEVQKQADQIVRDRLAEREAARRLGVFEEQRKIEAEMEQLIPLDIEVVIARFNGDVKVSSLPYALVVNATRQAKQPVTVLRMGGRVPVPAATFTPFAGADGKAAPVMNSWSYEDVSTQIDCSAAILRDGRFDLTLSIEDTGVATPVKGADGSTLPILRSFRTKNNVVLRDGQTRQFTVAADRLTGETVRIDVTLRVVK
jgi:hypothetical protein